MESRHTVTKFLIVCCAGGWAGAEPATESTTADETRAVSPVLSIEHDATRNPGAAPTSARPSWARSIDGSGNNLLDPTMGAAHTPLRRQAAPDYADGVSAPAGADRPGPREISDALCTQNRLHANDQQASDFLWQWGQFLDHDLDLTDGVDPPEPMPIPIPAGDPFFDPTGQGGVTLPFNRSIYDPASGTDPGNPRQQLNELTAWIDASNVYGSDEVRETALRVLDGSSRLKTSAGDLLPFNLEGLPNGGGSSPSLFLAGDVRANEQVGLTAMHTLFVREHNRLAAEIAAEEPSLSGDEIYERARQIVGALLQVITYNEYLPTLLGPDALAPYAGYKSWIDGRISNLFSTAAYRYGHSALSPTLLRLDAHGVPLVGSGHLPLRDAFFAPSRVIDEGGIEPLLRGLASQHCQTIDPFVVEDVRSFLFGPPGAGGFDLPALNIQRGRDHGLPSYNDARQAMGLSRKTTFAQVSWDPEVRARLAAAYPDVDRIDPWVGGLAEDPLPGAMVGELVFTVLKRQFERLRDADRFWYQIALPPDRIAEVEATRLWDIIARNTDIGSEVARDVFHIRSVAGIEVDRSWLAWQPQPWATGYQIVRGDLTTLRASGGDFSAATQSCFASAVPISASNWTPAPGQGGWYLVRGIGPGTQRGTYNTGTAGQIGFRDAEIGASPASCP